MNACKAIAPPDDDKSPYLANVSVEHPGLGAVLARLTFCTIRRSIIHSRDRK